MNFAKAQFTKQCSRDKVQMLIDIDVFKKDTTAQDILHYLQSPYEVIIKTYNDCYEKSWEDVQAKYSTERAGKDIMKEFYEIQKSMSDLLEQYGIDEGKRNFSDFFEIVDKDIKIEDYHVTQEEYQLSGKRVLYEYLIDTLLGENSKMYRKCAKIEVRPLIPIDIMAKPNISLRGILFELKAVRFLSLTILVIFARRLLAPETREKINQEMDRLNRLTEKNKIDYITKIKVVVCNEKCPCCGRICG